MNFEHKVFANQFPIVQTFVYHLIYYRVLLKGYEERQLQDEFWTQTIDAHLLRAVINWCMVFGSDKSEPTHWKQLSITDSKALYKSFREGLFVATDLNQHTWQQYWKSVVDFRNKYAVHRELEFSLTESENFRRNLSQKVAGHLRCESATRRDSIISVKGAVRWPGDRQTAASCDLRHMSEHS